MQGHVLLVQGCTSVACISVLAFPYMSIGTGGCMNTAVTSMQGWVRNPKCTQGGFRELHPHVCHIGTQLLCPSSHNRHLLDYQHGDAHTIHASLCKQNTHRAHKCSPVWSRPKRSMHNMDANTFLGWNGLTLDYVAPFPTSVTPTISKRNLF